MNTTTSTVVVCRNEYVCLTCGLNFDMSSSGEMPDYYPLRCPDCGSQDVIEQA